MFKRITINSVASSKTVRIAFTLLVPETWAVDEDTEVLAAHPRWSNRSGFTVLMPHRDAVGPAAELRGRPGDLERYMAASLPDLEEQDWEDGEEAAFSLDFHCFRGRVADVPGRVAALVSTLAVEDVNFVLMGVCRDELFHRMRPVFRTMITSFQPIVTGAL